MDKKIFKNIVYVGNGTQISNVSEESLAEQTRNIDDWSKGSIVLESENDLIVVPKNCVVAINSRVEEETNE